MTSSANGFAELTAMSIDLQQRIMRSDFRQALELFQREIAAREADSFGDQSSPDGDAWQALTSSTIREKGDAKILVKSGALMASLVTVGGEGNIHNVDRNELTFGTNVPYANFLEDGTSRMPQRPFVEISEKEIGQLVETIADTAMQSLRETD